MPEQTNGIAVVPPANLRVIDSSSASSPGGGESKGPKAGDEPAWAYLIPPHIRSKDWLARVSREMEVAARSWPAQFAVSGRDIREKLMKAGDLVVLSQSGASIGFVSVTRPLKLKRTGLSARYIEGTICHRRRGGKGKFGRMMEALGERADIEVLHTQNPYMAVSLRTRSKVLFPAPDYAFSLKDELYADLRDFLEVIGRDNSFDPLTGIAPGQYKGGRLYSEWPMPGSADARSFSEICQKDAVLVVGFRDDSAAGRLLNRAT